LTSLYRTHVVLGIEWRISFQNTAILNAIGEEFCSLLQITLCEIGLLGTDLHLLQLPVSINITQALDYTNWLNQRLSHEQSVWDASIPSLDTKEQSKIQFHYGYIATNIKILLNDLSLLPKEEFDKIFDDLYIKQRLHTFPFWKATPFIQLFHFGVSVLLYFTI
jgi:hypothetical protein